MTTEKFLALLVVLIILLEMIPVFSDASDNDLVISEVMANPLNENTDEFIELYNHSDDPIDLADWKITDGDAVDDITAWQGLIHRELAGTKTETTLIPAHGLAVILDNNYLEGEQPYNFPENTVIMTVGNTTLGNGLTASSDPITLYNANYEVIDTYGTPLDETEPLARDDDGLDNIPFDPGNGISVEKIDLTGEDSEDNWAANAANSATPGAPNNPYVNLPPSLEETLAVPASIFLDGQTTTELKVRVMDPNGTDDIKEIFADLSAVGGSNKQIFEAAADNWFTYELLPEVTIPGQYQLPVQVSDWGGETDSANINLNLLEPSYSQKIIINEILPNPSEPETEAEFIELYNRDEVAVDLTGWEITDDSRTYKIATTINAGQHLAFYNVDTGISLNNTGDTVRLLNPSGQQQDSVSYQETAKEDYAYACREDDTFAWTTTPTPNSPNVFSVPANTNSSATTTSSSDTTVPTTTTVTTTTDIELLDIAAIRNQPKDTLVKTRGVVTAAPGMLNAKYFYIQDSKSGIQIYASDGNFPELKIGEEIEISGKTSETQGESRLNVKDGLIEKIGTAEQPTPLAKTTGEINEEFEGRLVTTTGPISRQSGQTFYLDDSSGEAKISILKDTGIVKPKMTKGDTVTITGIVSETSAGHRILPRQQADLGDGGEVAAASDTTKTKELPNAGPNYFTLGLIALIIVLVIFTALKFSKIKKVLRRRRTSPLQ